LHDWFGSFPWSDFVAVPLIVRRHSVGALNVYCRHPPTAADLLFFRAMGDQSAIAIENARLFSESKRRSELDERTRIARGLHDAISQKLFSVTLHAKALELAMGNDSAESLSAAAGSARAMSGLAQSAIQDMRDVINELYPAALTRDGLSAAVRDYCAGLADREDVQITVSAPPDRLTIEPRAEENLYWLCVEALHNVVKHAEATTARVRIEPDSAGDDTLLVEVTDDGIGFDPTTVPHQPNHIGLTSMLERMGVNTRGLGARTKNIAAVMVTAELPAFAAAIRGLRSEQDYAAFARRWAVRRNNPEFWAFSDELHTRYFRDQSLEAGVLDYSRLESR
jgi:signal transduction histidine kinase